MTYSLSQKRVLVVGGSSGIGEAAAKALSALGADVVIASRNQNNLDAAAARIGDTVSTAVLDTGDNAAVEAFFAGQPAFYHIVVSAAKTPGGPVRQLPLDQAKAAVESKFWGAYRIARAAKISEDGSLTFVSGYLSDRPGDWVLQGAINAGLDSLARGLALELSPVRVNSVSPGMIATPLWSGIPEDARQKMYADTAAGLPAKRIGQPEDIANAIVYLVTTPYATGSRVLVDGGATIA